MSNGTHRFFKCESATYAQLAAAVEIDYDGSELTAATMTAIANLETKSWQININ